MTTYEDFLEAYPSSLDLNKTHNPTREWDLRVSEGFTPDELLLAAQLYHKYCVFREDINTLWVKHPAKFLKDVPFIKRLLEHKDSIETIAITTQDKFDTIARDLSEKEKIFFKELYSLSNCIADTKISIDKIKDISKEWARVLSQYTDKVIVDTFYKVKMNSKRMPSLAQFKEELLQHIEYLKAKNKSNHPQLCAYTFPDGTQCQKYGVFASIHNDTWFCKEHVVW